MIRIAISGVPGRLASAVAAAVAAADDLELTAAYNPRRSGESFMGLTIATDPTDVDADVVYESTDPGVVMDNLAAWRRAGMHAVVGTSGFTADRLATLRAAWGADGPGCLVVPNFSIGAVLMMRFAEQAAPLFSGVEIVERHHHDKPDAPSGTSIATAARVAAAGGRSIERSAELVPGARGGDVDGVRVHSMRMEATLSDQEVAYSRPGELLSIRHIGTSYDAYAGGSLIAMRYVPTISGVEVGLDGALDWWSAAGNG
jgi:4-hydroxy-tetrahydrodipicolinate reductase